MTETLPEPQSVALTELAGGDRLFERPTDLLEWSVPYLRQVAANLGHRGGSLIAQLRRYSGLVAWAAWHRLSEKECREFYEGLAGDLGIKVDTLRDWRDSIVKKEHLSVPDLARLRGQARKTAGQTPSKGKRPAPGIIKVPSTDVSTTEEESRPPKSTTAAAAGTASTSTADEAPSATSTPFGAEAASPTSPPKSRTEPAAEDFPRGSEPTSPSTDGTAPSRSDRPRARVAAWIAEGLAIGPEMLQDFATVEELTALGHLLPRRQGTITRPGDRRSEPTPEPGNCRHPKDKRRKLGWGTLCGVCNAKVS